jgi:hypothetical protein
VAASGIEIGVSVNIFRQEFPQLPASHEPRRNFRHGYSGGL